MALLSRPFSLPSNSQLQALLDAVDEALVLFDGRGRVAWCNAAAQRVLGCAAGQSAPSALALLAPPAKDALLALVLGAGPAAGVGAAGDAGVDAVLADARPWRLQLGRQGSGWLLRATAQAPSVAPEAQPRLAPGATAELVALLWDSPQALLVADTDWRVRAVNRAFLALCGLPSARVIGSDLAETGLFGDAAQPAQWRARLQAALADGSRLPIEPERLWTDSAGRRHALRAQPRWISADDGAPLLLVLWHVVGVEPASAAPAAGDGGAAAQWFDASPGAMLVYDGDGRVLRCNAAFAQLTGCAPTALREAPAELCRLLGWDAAGLCDSALPVPGEPTPERRATLTTPDGRRLRLLARLRALAPAAGAPRQVLALVEDRSLEDAHDLAQLEIASLMTTAGLGVATYEASRGWVSARLPQPAPDASAPAPDDRASAAANALQAIGGEQVDPASRAEFDRLQKALRAGQRAQVRYAVLLPELGRRWLLTRVAPGALTDGRPTLSVVTLDITEQEEAHRRSELLLHELSTILDVTSAGMAYLRGAHLVRCNRRFEALLGLPAGRSAGAPIAELLAGQGDALALLRRAAVEPGRHDAELARPAADGATQWLALSATGTGDGAPDAAASASGPAAEAGVVVVVTDVTRFKRQQAELAAVERERALMFSLSDIGVAYLREGRIQRANAALERLTGYSAAELQHMHQAALYEDDAAYQRLWPPRRQALKDSGEGGGHWRGERRLRCRDGSLRWVQVSKRRIGEASAPLELICSFVDMDERRAAREALQLQAERTRAILDSVLVGIVTVGNGGIEWMNRSARRMFGGELADFIGQPIATVATDEPDHPLRATHYLQALADGQAETFECRLRARDGRAFWVVGNAVVTGRGASAGAASAAAAADAAGGSQITFALLDIERRRQAEVSIAQAQASLQRIIDTAPLAIALFDGDSGRVLRLNQMAASFFGRPVPALLGRPPEEWFAPSDAQALRADLQAARAHADGLRRELARPGADSAAVDGDDRAPARVWDMRIVALDERTRGAVEVGQMLLVASDVTEQRAAEKARFDAAVAQRDMLVKEVHHRIKNNLQGVAGLLQQTAARRPEVAELIGEAVGQVQAIAQIHGLQVGAGGPLRVRPVVEAIAASVQRTFGRAIAVDIDGAAPERFALPEAEAIPIALTVNELLTNAVKHGAPGAIRCVLQCDEARLAIAVRSPGQLPAGFSLQQVPPGVSGLGLVRALLPRRSATLTLLPFGGAEVEARVVLVPPGIALLAPL